jgi:tight adherence protein C
MPSILLTRRIQQRYEQIDKSLPELIDLLVVAVEAGLGFVAALRMCVQELEGPLAQELRLTLQEQTMGLSTPEALQGMGRRVETPGVRSFVRSIVQGSTLGISLGQILRNLSEEMRKRRKAAAEEKAQKAPVKMLFPLILLIFPAMFVVLLLPAIITIADTLGG